VQTPYGERDETARAERQRAFSASVPAGEQLSVRCPAAVKTATERGAKPTRLDDEVLGVGMRYDNRRGALLGFELKLFG
jgi:hypothetical protein